MTNDQLRAMMQRYLAPPNGDTPQDTKAKMLYWRNVVLNPDKYAADAHPLSVKKAESNARQNFRRLVQRHPDLAAQIMSEVE
jgi:hypothetical protein